MIRGTIVIKRHGYNTDVVQITGQTTVGILHSDMKFIPKTGHGKTGESAKLITEIRATRKDWKRGENREILRINDAIKVRRNWLCSCTCSAF